MWINDSMNICINISVFIADIYHFFVIVLCCSKSVKKEKEKKEEAIEYRRNFQKIIAYRIHNKI